MTVGIRIALKPHVGLRDVQTFSVDQNMNITTATREDETPVRFGWETLDGTTSLDYLEDNITGVHYITIKGQRIAEFKESIRGNLATWSFQEAAQLISENNQRDTIIQGIHVSAITAARKDVPALSAAFQRMARQPDREVRRAVLIGIGYATTSAELREIAQEMKNSDPDEDIRLDAEHLLAGLNSAE
ncbi:hypothetical protein ACF1BU_31565 [Streptomyces sp. NPDC014724]|uniref:hypothetical protein n=1 Tax=unclassified Streptomyces TaxID=2593676 RepID=UPI0036FE5F95